MATPREQLELLKMGTVDFITDAELLKKIEKSQKEKRPLRIKFGADPTRPDLHLGHTVVLNKLRQFQKLGHRVHFLIGDFTALIGDPSGRNETRPPLSPEQIEVNARSYAEQIFKVLDSEKTDIVYNSHWFHQLTPADFIRLTGQYTVARMLERDDFTKRFRGNIPISIHELLYPLCQGYDSVHLKSDVEMGGTDQKFNLLVGRELQKSYGQTEQQVVVTTPILEGLDGVNKMSKSLDNYIAVVDSPREMFGKTMRVSDELMLRWHELLTDITPMDLNTLKQDLGSGKRHPRDVKIHLAKELITRFHSASQAQAAEEEFHRIFVEKGLPDEVPEQLVTASSEPIGICNLMKNLGLAPSNSEARRLIQGRAVEIDGTKVSDEQLKIELKSGLTMVIRAGKKKFVKVVVR
ncbi:MAG: tyrosine--tRNA ligase [Bdellovibrio sp. CG10_big_fil_rev_8_21_14_0_10_47_8]|nr:MAG: tyrosine--tRNA ligase [Bdellovibrio sp. CG10_big_fil_rev_8_21_14_0_10_47_8]